MLFSHAANKGLIFFEGFSIAGSGSGKVGVYLFFVLSAFLLTDQILKRQDRYDLLKAEYIKRYIKKRFLRIFPLYILFLLFLWGAASFQLSLFPRFSEFSLKSLLEHLFLLKGEAHLWTIKTEFKFYMLLPILCFMLIPFVMNVFKIAGMICSISIFSFSIFYLSDVSFFLYIPIFLSGLFAACLFHKYPSTPFPLPRTHVSWLTLMLCFIMLLIMPKNILLVAGLEKINMASPVPCSFYAIFWGVIILLLLWYESPLKALLESRFLCFLGLISYSVYLWHWLILDLFSSSIFENQAANILGFYFFTLIISFVSYKYIEMPFLQLKNKK